MRIAVYTLTRDRLEYTQRSFEALGVNAGVPFRHYVVDNGSDDDTVHWLTTQYKPFHLNALEKNAGISRASNLALDVIFETMPDVELIVKMDNDCVLKSVDTFFKMGELFRSLGPFAPKFVLSPRVVGINKQPHRGRMTQIEGEPVGLTAIVGGLCHFVPAFIYRAYRYPLDLPLAAGQDDHFCKWVKSKGGEVGYVESLVVEHIDGTDGQCAKFPDYFKRKWEEEKKK